MTSLLRQSVFFVCVETFGLLWVTGASSSQGRQPAGDTLVHETDHAVSGYWLGLPWGQARRSLRTKFANTLKHGNVYREFLLCPVAVVGGGGGGGIGRWTGDGLGVTVSHSADLMMTSDRSC